MSSKVIIYFLLLLFASLSGLLRWKRLSLPDRIIAALMPITLTAELMAIAGYECCGDSFPVYHIYTPLEFLLISLYFNFSLDYFRKRHIGLIAGLSGIALSLFNTLFLQDISTTNSYFILFEGTVIIVYALLALRQILLDEEHLPYRFTLFWLSICFIVYWSATFTGWGFFAALGREDAALISIFDKVLTAANFVFYLGIGTVFLLYPKMIPSRSAA